jgi:hypothetical protein
VAGVQGFDDFAWVDHRVALAEQPARGAAGRRSQGAEGDLLGAAHRPALGRHPRGLRATGHPTTASCAGGSSGSGIASLAVLASYDGGPQMVGSSSIRVHQHGATSTGGLRRERRPCAHRSRPLAGRSDDRDPRSVYLAAVHKRRRREAISFGIAGAVLSARLSYAAVAHKRRSRAHLPVARVTWTRNDQPPADQATHS